MSTRLTRKGQVTIPKRIREHLGAGPGAAIDFELAEDGRVTVRRAGKPRRAGRSIFQRVRGRASARLSTDQIMALTRGDA
jgi:AbrB family looped-hinge helix DNA binding protein